MSPTTHQRPLPARRTRRCRPARRQRGVVFIFTLVFALLLLLPAMGAMKTVMMGERKSGDLRHQSLSLQAAEAAIAAAEAHLQTTGSLDRGITGAGDYGLGQSPFDAGVDGGLLSAWTQFNWEAADPRATRVQVTINGTPRDAFYVIETLPKPSSSSSANAAFRVTAYARGAHDEAATLLQTTYTR